MDETCWSARDLHWVLDTALTRGQSLLTAGEAHVIRRLRELDEASLDVYARLTTRVSAFQRASELTALDELLAAGLVDHLVPWSVRAQHSTVAELKQGLKKVGERRSGARPVLVERLSPHTHWSTMRWVRIRHRGLVRRLERWAFLRSRPDRSVLVVERLGHVAWPDYSLTRGAGFFGGRRRLLRWEAMLEETHPETLCDGLDRGDAAGPGRLDRSRSVAKRILEHARQLEREADPGRARALYSRVARALPSFSVHCAVRTARTFEAEGRALEALDALQRARSDARGPERLTLNRSGRRVARVARRGWAPDRPLQRPRERSLSLRSTAHTGLRPTYREGLVVEHAVVDLLAEHGRSAVHAEGGVWVELFAQLFSDCYFLPVEGQLPVRRLAGPLDLGSPRFAARRREAVDAVLAGVARGEAPHHIREAWSRFSGQRLTGCRWEGSCEEQVRRVEAIGPELLHSVLRVLLERGWRAARGLPDLLVMPGPAAILPRGIPGKVPPGLLLVEVKGPTDTLSDAQRWWIAHLATVAPVEVWNVQAARGPHGL